MINVNNIVKTKTPVNTHNQHALHLLKKDIAKFPPLEKEKERQFIIKYQETGEKEYKQKVIQSNLRYIYLVAVKYSDAQQIDIRELVNEGVIGLGEAIERFDPNHKYKDDEGKEHYMKFYSFGTNWIYKYILEYILTQGIIKRGQYSAKARKEITIAINKFYTLHERCPAPHELLDGLGSKINIKSLPVMTRYYQEAELNVYKTLQISSSYDEDSKDANVNHTYVPLEDSEDEISEDNIWDLVLPHLTYKEQNIIQHLYGLNFYETLDNSQIAEKFNIEEDELQTLLDNIHLKLKNNINA